MKQKLYEAQIQNSRTRAERKMYFISALLP